MFLSNMTEGEHYMKIITNISKHSKHDWRKKKLFKANGKSFLFNEFFGYKQVLNDISSM